MKLVEFNSFSKTAIPPELYSLIYTSFLKDHEGEKTYITTPVTSGGAIHLGLPIERVIKENMIFSVELLDLLKKNNYFKDTDLVVLPSLLETMGFNGGEKWKEREYLSLWIAIFSGMHPDLFKEYWDEITNSDINWSNFNNRAADPQSRSKRIDAYKMLEDLSLELINRSKADCQPFDRLTKFPDSSTSLGSTLEQRLAAMLGIKLEEVHINQALVEKLNLSIKSNQVYLKLIEMGKIPSFGISDSSLVTALNCIASDYSSNI